MRLYLTESQVPELGPLPRSATRLAVRQALALMRKEMKFCCWLPTLLCVAGGAAGALVGAGLLDYAASLGYLQKPARLTGDWIMLSAACSYAGVGVGAFSAGFVGLHLQRSKLRPYLRKAIAEHQKSA